jgi:hypothetical protein
MISLLCSAAILSSAFGGASAQAVPSSHPKLAVAINVKENGTPEDFVKELRFQIRLGLNGSLGSFKWEDLEPPQGDRNLKPLADYLGLLPIMEADSAVTIQTIDTTNRTVPADLPQNWDDPLMLARWDSLLNQIIPALGKHVKYVSLGNEVDVRLLANPGELKGYKTFLNRGKETIQKLRSDLKVGVTVTGGTILTQPQYVLDLTKELDLLFVTYYAVGQGFKVKTPTEIQSDLNRLLAFDPGRKMIISEIGMPASEVIGGSEAKQAAFVSQVFKTFSGKGSKVPLLAWFITTDFSPPMVDLFQTYYGLKDPSFAAYLATLGLKDHTGRPRLAFKTFSQESQNWVPAIGSNP